MSDDWRAIQDLKERVAALEEKMEWLLALDGKVEEIILWRDGSNLPTGAEKPQAVREEQDDA